MPPSDDKSIRVSAMPPPPQLMAAMANDSRIKPPPPPTKPPPVRKAPMPPTHVLGMINEAGGGGGANGGGGFEGFSTASDDDGDNEPYEEEEEEEEGEEEEEEEEEETPEQAVQRAFLEEQQKTAMLARIAKIKSAHRLTGPCMSRHTDIEDVRFELQRLEDELVLRQSVKVQRRVLMAVASGIELLHHKTPARGKLTGWSEAIMSSIDDYDDVFDRLHRKHAPKFGFGKGRRTEPELELAMAVGYSAFSFALSNTMTNLGQPTQSQKDAAARLGKPQPAGFSEQQYKQRAKSLDFSSEEKLLGTFSGPAAHSSAAAMVAAGASAAPPAKAVTFSTSKKAA